MAHKSKRRKISEGRAITIEGGARPTHHEDIDNLGANITSSSEHINHRRQLFVRSLAPETTSDDLVDLFSQSYPIKHAVAVLDHSTNQCKGYGFVTFADTEDAQNAKDELQNATLHGRNIKLDIAEPRHRDHDREGQLEAPKTAKQESRGKAHQNQGARPNTLIIRNLPWSIKNQEQLTDLFKSYGKVKRANLPTKGGSKTLRGFGIVVMRNHDQAAKALEAVNGKEIGGRMVAVDWAVDKDTYHKLQQASQSENDETQDAIGNADEHVLNEDALTANSLGHDNESDNGSADDEDEEFEESDSEDGDSTHLDAPSTDHDQSNTVFVRNLPFQASDESMKEHFAEFGPVRYARIVIDSATGMPKGTGFVCFFKKEHAEACLKGAPKGPQSTNPRNTKGVAGNQPAPFSVLQNVDFDPSGRYTMEGRVLQVSQAVNREEAERLRAEGVANRFARDTDKRRLYLLHEGTVATNSPLYKQLTPAEITLREASLKQRKALLESNPSLHLSLTRLSVRNIPRSISSTDLKSLARSAVVGFATDVKNGARQPLSKEELSRGGEEMKQAEKDRKAKGKGVVKQAKIVFENRQGGKINEASGAGRSRGYGFIEYYSHRSALMGLRWLNGHEVGYATAAHSAKSSKRKDDRDRKKRLIVEFAIENAQVVQRRKERESKGKGGRLQTGDAGDDEDEIAVNDAFDRSFNSVNGMKRKRNDSANGETWARSKSRNPHHERDVKSSSSAGFVRKSGSMERKRPMPRRGKKRDSKR